MTPFLAILVKLSRYMEPWFVQLVELLLKSRRFRVHIGSSTSSWRLQKNGLPQGSVLAPSLFNLYTNDLPVTKCRRFTYADDICCVVQAKSFEEVESTLTSDMAKIAEYCRRWRLKPSAPKTVSIRISPAQQEPRPGIERQFERTAANS